MFPSEVMEASAVTSDGTPLLKRSTEPSESAVVMPATAMFVFAAAPATTEVFFA
jgi:hypothetical protein